MTKEWIRRRKKDPYYRKAKAEGFRSRAAYKIKQMDQRVRLIKKGSRILDLGASPGGWSQYAVQQIGDEGLVVAVDLIHMEPVEGVNFIRGDINDEGVLESVKGYSEKYDLVMSDVSPALSGNRTLDRGRSLGLAWSVLQMAVKVLDRNGNVVVKMFQGDEMKELKDEFANHFWKVENHKPRSSLKKSIEIYLIFRGFKPSLED